MSGGAVSRKEGGEVIRKERETLQEADIGTEGTYAR